MTRGAVFILLGLQLLIFIRGEQHAIRFDQRAEALNGNIYRLMETSDHVLHNVSRHHPQHVSDLIARPPVPGCKLCSDLAREKGAGL